jgi:hypothetical protein
MVGAVAQPSVVDCGSARLHLFEDETVAPDAAAPARLHHVALEAEDLDEFRRLRSGSSRAAHGSSPCTRPQTSSKVPQFVCERQRRIGSNKRNQS